MTVDEVLDSAAQLGYVYDDLPSFRMAPPPPEAAPEPGAPPELVAATERAAHAGRRLGDRPDRRSGGHPGDLQDRRRPRPRAGARGPRGHQGGDQPRRRLRGLPQPARRRRATGTRHHIGNVSLFGIEKMNDPDIRHEGAPGFRHIFDATRVAGELSEQGDWDPAAVTVTFEPIEVLPPPGEEATWDSGGARADDRPAHRDRPRQPLRRLTPAELHAGSSRSRSSGGPSGASPPWRLRRGSRCSPGSRCIARTSGQATPRPASSRACPGGRSWWSR